MKKLLFVFPLLLAAPLYAANNSILEGYRAAAKQSVPGFTDFSATRGETLYKTKTGDLACATCHGASPKGLGKHVRTDKQIEPLAPSANAKRFTEYATVEKWFRRNCKDVLKRNCTAAEKGDFITYLLSVK